MLTDCLISVQALLSLASDFPAGFKIASPFALPSAPRCLNFLHHLFRPMWVRFEEWRVDSDCLNFWAVSFQFQRCKLCVLLIANRYRHSLECEGDFVLGFFGNQKRTRYTGFSVDL